MARSEKPLEWQGAIAIDAEGIAYIRGFVERFPGLARSEMIYTLCEHLQWVTPAGGPKYDAGKKLLQRLEERGEIRLPGVQTNHVHSREERQSWPKKVAARVAIIPEEELQCALGDIGPVQLRLLREGPEQAQCNAYLAQFHPLGYRQPIGFAARYRVQAGERSLGYVLLAGAAKAIDARDRWIGWSARQRLTNLPWVVNNSRFLIFPWVAVRHLASHVLGQLARQLADDWQSCWGFRPLLLESFVDPLHYRGSCYRAAGWELLGHTSGRGLARPGQQYRSSPKLIFVKPVQPQWRELLCSANLQGPA